MEIKISNLSKSYGPQKAVNNISFEVKTGEILGFLGPNGAGKSTTMKMITHYISPSSGDITIAGRSVRDHAEELKQYIGYLPENNPLYPEMPVVEYLEFMGALQGVPKSRMAERVREMVRVCGLDVEKHKRIGELSKGYRQRVGLAQAMIHDPQILILDEPTTGLDPNQIVEIRELIKKLGKEKTVILSTHILPEVEATCDRILIINRGAIVADGTPDTLRKQSQGKEILHLQIEEAEPAQVLTALQQLPTVDTAKILQLEQGRFEVESHQETSSRRAVFQLCKEQGWFLTELTPLETKLEDIFRDLTLN